MNTRTTISWTKCLLIFIFEYQAINPCVLCTNCNLKESCGRCIAEDPECAWCSQENFSGHEARRCDVMAKLMKTCSKESIVSPLGSLKLIKDMSLSDKGAKEGEAIQIKPQEITVRLRPNSVQRFQVEFRQAVDHPVDLYYLMDLSNTMEDDKAKLSLLGQKLAGEMGNITTNFKLGFGSFVDKILEPYTNTHPAKLREPCLQCAAPYGFFNNVPLSSSTQEFAVKVEKAPVSGNIDGPEGGFDAVMQAVVCKEHIGWRNTSRKLLVFSTDSTFHYAGDGKLGGLITPNDEKCHLDASGYYTKSTELDYPSLSQINRQIREHKINMIFAVTRDETDMYEKLSKRLVGSSVGTLEQDASNVMDLVKQQYDKITSAVEMTDDTGDSNILISYFSSCLGGETDQTNICRDLKVGQNVTFDVNLVYSFCPDDPKQRNRTFHIFPVGLQDQLTIHLEMICDCDCEKPWNKDGLSYKCSDGNGTFECGVCKCHQQRFGKECECDATKADRFHEVEECHNGNDTRICSDAGHCRCGRCTCNKRQNPNEHIYGKYCECNNYSCDTIDGKVCNDHGVCDCGSCKCMKGWTGEDCGCRNTTNTCMSSSGEICSGRGKCICGSCVCDRTKQNYFGTHCHDCSTCPGMCKELRDCVECFLQMQTGVQQDCSVCGSVNVQPVKTIEVKEKEKQCTFEDENKCRFTFKYAFDEENFLTVWTQLTKECPVPVDKIAIVSGICGLVNAIGLVVLLLWKILTHFHDRRELAKFEKELLMTQFNQGQNHSSKEVETAHQNPACEEHSTSKTTQESKL